MKIWPSNPRIKDFMYEIIRLLPAAGDFFENGTFLFQEYIFLKDEHLLVFSGRCLIYQKSFDHLNIKL